MSTSPMPIRADPFIQGIIEFSHQCNMEESVVLIRQNEGGVNAEFHMITNIDPLFLNMFLLSFVIMTVLLICFDDNSLFSEENSFFSKINILIFNLILPVFHLGKKFQKFYSSLLISFRDVIK